MKARERKTGGGMAEEGMTAGEFYKYSERKGASRHLGAIGAALRATRGRTVLDVGCGAGFTAGRLAMSMAGALVCGCDTDRELLRMAGLRENGVRWVCSGTEKLPFRDGAFDLVYSEGALHHFDDPLSMAAEMWRVLGPGGRLLIIDLNPRSRAANAYHFFVAAKKFAGVASKADIALMLSIENALPMDTGLSLMEAAGIPARVSCTLASIYYEAEKKDRHK